MAPVIEDASTTKANEEMYVVRIGKPCLAMGVVNVTGRPVPVRAA
jgi:hypothetical protein